MFFKYCPANLGFGWFVPIDDSTPQEDIFQGGSSAIIADVCVPHDGESITMFSICRYEPLPDNKWRRADEVKMTFTSYYGSKAQWHQVVSSTHRTAEQTAAYMELMRIALERAESVGTAFAEVYQKEASNG